MKNKNLIKYIFVSLLTLVFIPSGAHAAGVYVESAQKVISVGDTAVVTIKVNSDKDILNTIEGDISVPLNGSSVYVQEFSLAGSAFGLWPRTPSLSTDGQTISFVGGVPGGFSIQGATLFKMVIEAKKAGVISITPRNIVAYASDGKGTKVPVEVKGLTLEVRPRAAGVPVNDEWKAVVSADLTPPQDFIVVLGQDSTIFSGKKFAFFSAVDNESGIDHYDVSENGRPAVRSGSTYELQDQTGTPKLTVIAYDKAGNKKEVQYTARGQVSWPLFAITVIVVAGGFIVSWRKSRKNVSKTS